jgi:integrase
MARANNTNRRGDGVFKIRNDKIYVHGTINGKFYRKSTGKTATAANKAWIKRQDPLKVLAEILGEVNQESKTDLEGFGNRVIELITKDKSYEYQKDVYRVFNNYILPSFRHINLENIKAIDLINFLENLKTELSDSRVHFIKVVFNQILDYALDNEIITSNPFNKKTVKNVEISKEPAKKREAYTPEEMDLILQNAKGWLKIFLDISFKTGVRTGEAMGLKWEDIDLENGILYVKRTIHKGIIKEKKSKNKNHDREIVLFDSTLQLLKNYYEVRPADDFLFINKDKRHYKESKVIVDSHFKPLLEKIGVKYKTLYATRATYISIMSFSGNNLEDIQQKVGHKKGSKVTEKNYIDPRILKVQQKRKKAEEQETLFNSMIEK